MIVKAARYKPEEDMWIYNAANGYLRASGLPDYSAMAEGTYSSFINDLNTTKTRGIILQNFVGQTKNNRLTIGQVIAIGVTALAMPRIKLPSYRQKA